MDNKTRYKGIDGLKACAIIGIVLMHVLSNGEYRMGGFVFEQFIPSFTNLVFLFTGQSSRQVPRWHLLRDLSVPHGNLSCA